jgi:hypothetical protein
MMMTTMEREHEHEREQQKERNSNRWPLGRWWFSIVVVGWVVVVVSQKRAL